MEKIVVPTLFSLRYFVPLMLMIHTMFSRYVRKAHFGLDTGVDTIFQTTNIMLDFHNDSYDVYDIKSLVDTGVNIFNVDLSVHDSYFFERVKGVIRDTRDMLESSPPAYYRPIGLSVTMSILSPLNIDDEVDILILKDITEKEQFLEFKQRNKNSTSMAILLRLAAFKMDDANELIKISDGVIIDLDQLNIFDRKCDGIMQMCREAGKPFTYLIPELAEDYYERVTNDRKLLTIASHLVNNRADGLMLVASNNLNKAPKEAILAFVKAIKVAENDVQAENVYRKLSFETNIPILPPMATAMAASLGALKIGAKAIIIITKTGRSGRVMSAAAPPCNILAITTRKETARTLHMYRKVIPLFYDKPCAQNWRQERRNRVSFGTDFGLKTGLFCTGAKLVVLAPSEEGTGYCDGFQIVAVPFACDE